MPRKPRDDDEESEGSLKDFIVRDDEESSEDSEDDCSDTDESSDESDDESSDESSDEESATSPDGPAAAGAGAVEVPRAPVGGPEGRPNKRRRHDESQDIELMKNEAERFAAGVTGTVVGGRTLRSRAPEHVESRKPRDSYYEKYGRAEEEKLMEKFTKKDIVEFVARLAPDHKAEYEAAGYVWPVLNVRMSLESIRAEYDKIKAFLDLPDSDKETSDDEDSDEDMSDDDTDESDD